MTNISIPAGTGPAVSGRTIAGHPAGLAFLFMTELWERFSYYGMRALLVYYMTKHLLIPQAEASNIYGIYTALVYFTPLFGGILADRVFGQHKMVLAGGILMALGHFLMAWESLFYVALGFIILGNGAFKPNISTQVGNLYPEGDPRRDRAFSIFYVGINIGAFLAPLVCGYLGETVGWHYGFGAAGVGMVIGLITYIAGRKYLPPDNLAREKAAHVEHEPLHKGDWEAIGALILISFFTIFFWATYEQQGNTIALWADTNTDRVIALGSWSWEVPASWFQSVNPFMIFAFTPFMVALWANQSAKGREPTTVSKMAIGCFLVGISYLVMIGAAWDYAANGPTNMLWLVGFLAILTIGELYLSPIGLSLFSKVAPTKYVSLLFGVWFLSSFFGNYAAGWLGSYWEVWSKETFFFVMFLISAGAGLGILVFNKPLKRIIASRSASEARGGAH
ncbi:peptide MFS transporter [Aerophototrophica crusticola]|uniref:Peptide MFS transporter n=1 Tax=Aerophototrophica crusticola TaxID=1709002 RepID=A0A858R7F3_9PROT|nr:peptide MFS transporter [Rhodospirillaceae bacterium B3]